MPDSDDKNSTGRNIADPGAAVNNFSTENSDRPDGQDEFRAGVIGAGGTADNFGAENSGRDNFRGGGDAGNSDVEFPVVENSGGTGEIQGREFREENISAEITANRGGNFKNSGARNSGRENSAEIRLVEFLAASGLEPADVPGCRHVSNAELNHALGRDGKNRVAGDAIEISYQTLTGEPVLDRGQPFKRYRLLKPVKDGPKYLSRAGSAGHVYIPAGLQALISDLGWTDLAMAEAGGAAVDTDTGDIPRRPARPDQMLVVCEGEKKAERLVRLGFPAVGIAGVDMWADDAARSAEKAEAELAGRPPPRLNRRTKISRELLAAIRETGADHIVVVFDSDGRPAPAAEVRSDNRFKPIGKNGVKAALNPRVYWAGMTFAAALCRAVDVRVGLDFVPFAEADDGGRGRQGIDDWSLTASIDEIDDFIRNAGMNGRRMTAEDVDEEIERIEHEQYVEWIKQNQGFAALGYSSNGESTTYYVWSRYLKTVKHFTGSSLAKKPEFYGAFGAEYCDEILGKSVVIQRENEKEGIPEIRENRFDLDIGQRTVTRACQAAGRWSPGASVRGAGVWSDEETGGLAVNSRDGLWIVRPGGSAEEVERVRGGWIYESTERGQWTDLTATAEDVRGVIRTIENCWIWVREADGILLAGWVLAQAYVGALKARPGCIVSGESNCGKSYLEEWVKRLIGKWAWRIEDTRGSSIAGVAQLIKNVAMPIFFDEVEAKAEATPEEMAKANRNIAAIRQLLRSAYSRSDDEGSFGAVKGTAHQEAVARDVRISGFMTAIAEPDLEQADRNRNLLLKLRRLPLGPDGKPCRIPPPLPDPAVGLKIYRLMWSRWEAFQATLDRIEQTIDHREPRMQKTLAIPLAAIAVALGRHENDVWVEKLVEQINAEYGGTAAADDAPRDQDRALQRLLAATIDVGGAKKSIGDAVAAAISAGLGRPGGGRGAGGPDGDALRLNGLTARRNHDGTVALFVAKGHQGVEALGRHIGVASLAPLLGAVDGAVVAKREVRVRLGQGTKWPGVWVPTEIATIAVVDDADEPDTAQPAEEAAPY